MLIRINGLSISSDSLKSLYLEDHLTMSQIGRIFGVTRQNIHYLFSKSGIETDTGERFEAKCRICGKSYSITRKRFLTSLNNFCSFACYKKYLHNSEYKEWRNGQRIGRLVMEEHLDRRLRSGEVVHHIDGDNCNNEVSNLMVFKSHSEHLAFHHRERNERLRVQKNISTSSSFLEGGNAVGFVSKG